MRIAVASDDGVNVALHTGHCKGFVVYEVADESATPLEYHLHDFTAHALGHCQGEHAHDPTSGHGSITRKGIIQPVNRERVREVIG